MIASIQFPYVLQRSGIDPDSVTLGPGSWGILFAIALFLSILIHEFAHVLVAQAMGVKVRGITLMMLGGVSEMEHIPEKPYAEFKVSVVGPLTSLALGGILLFIQGQTQSGDLALFSYWLARVNIALAIFNLLPAFPLDGGRAFRSLLAARVGMASATRTSVSVAHGLAWALGIVGVLSFNFLLMLIAVFIYSTATGELVLSISRGMLHGVTAGAAGYAIEPVLEETPLGLVAELMLSSSHRVLPVKTRSGEPAIVTAEALRQIPRGAWDESTVSQVMQKVPRTLRRDEPLDEALTDLIRAQALPLEEDHRIVGLVDYRDVVDLLELKSLAEHPESGGKAA
jgi:Zn-dependent protease